MSTDEYIILGEIAAGNRPGSVYEYLSQQFLIVPVHRTYFSIYLIICVAFILYYFNEYCTFYRKKIKLLGVFSLVLITAAMICIQSKAGLGLLILLVASFFIIKVKKTFWSVVLLIVFFLGSLVLFKSILNYRFKPMIEEIKYILSPGNDNEKDYAKFLRPGSTEIRYMVYKSSFQLIEKAPFLGYGTGDVKDVLRTQNEKNNFVSIAHLNYGPHSQFLYILIAFGFLGLLVFISIFFFPILESFRMKDYFALSILIVIFLSGLTESVLIRQEGIIPISLFITILGRLKTNFRTL
ncbi:O-antigen ligase family protein [uncultured Aquimarina sp.]|uniref:O-antigen ligase family protein n=1 Tax=uncultured Aquimarina sp. TaxID=575652 RepID=UPI0026158E79|nr:O-antigen ligase family protein [uncultured Aquimarina sp.]